MNNKEAVRALLRRKIAMKTNSDALADNFAGIQGRTVKKQLAKFFGGLQTSIMVNKSIPNGEMAVRSRLKNFEVILDLSDLDDIYEKTALDFLWVCDASEKLRKADYSFVFNEIDEATLDMIRNSFFWMKADHSGELITQVEALIESAFLGEIARVDLAGYLEEAFGSILNAESRYFKDVTDHIISQGQNMARIAQGSKYDVQYYQVMAKMDSRTTKFCRSINGRIISAAHLEKQAKKILGATNSSEKIKAAAWVKDGPLKGNTLPANIGCPPYHYRCRTILQPYWPEEGELENVIKSAWFWRFV